MTILDNHNKLHNIEITPSYLNMFCDYIYRSFGIFTEESKKNILSVKICTLMRNADITDISQYYHYVVSPPITEKQMVVKNAFVDTITVHKTNFFRENNHFEFIKKNINSIISSSQSVKYSKELRVWSAAASTGEEAYTLAMVLKEILPADIKPKILATDVSPKSIQMAMNGAYKLGPEDRIEQKYLDKYFYTDINAPKTHMVRDEIKNAVTFRLFNLIDTFPFKTPFDIIFCRNVMIYFTPEVQGRLINKFYSVLSGGSHLFIGHSESLIKIKHDFTYVEPTIYKKAST